MGGAVIVWSAVTEDTVRMCKCLYRRLEVLLLGLQCNMQDTVECRSLYKAGLGAACVCVCLCAEQERG